MRKIKKFLVMASALTMAAACEFPAFAVERLEDLSLEVTASMSYDYGLSVEAEVYDDGCYVDEVVITNEEDEWEEGDKPKLKITVGADEDYAFASGLGKSDVILYEETGPVTSVTRSGSRKLYIYVTLPEIEEIEEDVSDYEDYDLDVYNLVWDEGEGGAAYWDGNDYAKKYEVRLFRDGEELVKKTTEEVHYNFSSYFKRGGSYHFEVRGIRGDDEGSWRESDSRSFSDAQAAEIYSNRTYDAYENFDAYQEPTEGAWLHDKNGWWWCNPDKTYPLSAWKQINGNWYYFNEGGYMLENQWKDTDGRWYYCGPSGAMLTNTTVPGGYYVDGNGVWIP